jgi:hypothetical protein
MPNTQEIMGLEGQRIASVWASRLAWRPSFAWSGAAGLLAALSILSLNDGQSPFIYFRF